jgi:hypothetical protein
MCRKFCQIFFIFGVYNILALSNKFLGPLINAISHKISFTISTSFRKVFIPADPKNSTSKEAVKRRLKTVRRIRIRIDLAFLDPSPHCMGLRVEIGKS